MKRFIGLLVLTIALVWPALAGDGVLFIDRATCDTVKQEMVQKFGAAAKFRIERGVDQVAELWRKEDGSAAEFAEYCKTYFIADEAVLDAAFKKMEFYQEVLGGFFGEMGIVKNQPLDLDWGEITPLDMAMAQFNPGAHIGEDMFQNKLAFFPLLNFPSYTLQEKMQLGPQWNRKQWAFARSGGSNNTRIPPEINQKAAVVMTNAGRYIAEYNILLGKLVDAGMNTFFPADMKLISHWGIRDEIKARYADKNGLTKQKMIQRVMERIILQEIPAVVVNNDKVQWDPFSNKVYENGKAVNAAAEPDTRYRTFLDVFNVVRLMDPYSPKYPTLIQRRFETGREIPEKDVEALFVELLSSPQAAKVGQYIRKRLQRDLLPFDIWYNGFQGDGSVSEEELDKIVAAKYPDMTAFEKDIPNILRKLGFAEADAAFIAPLIQVDPARGSGHCTGSGSRNFRVRLRTRVPKTGMNYKGYNIAMHELGHAVENVLTLHRMDYYSMSGVPNTAFTEAFAFIFQDRSLDVLGVKREVKNAWEMKVLDNFWNAYEIMGVALVDMKVWHWLYDHPQATPAQLKEAVVTIAKQVWNAYYAPIFKVKDQAILAIYSHMIDSVLYLPDYPLGHVIQFQLEDYLRNKTVGPEMARMCAAGNTLPQLWMKNAVGTDISVKPMLQAVEAALKAIK